MAWAAVTDQNTQIGNRANTDSWTAAYPANVANGNFLVNAGAVWKAGSAPLGLTITDTLGTTYTILSAALGADITLWIAFGVASSGGANTLTVDPAGTGNYLSWSMHEFSGQHATPLDVDDGTTGGTSSTPSGSITTATADDLIIGVMGHTAVVNEALTPGADYTQINEHESSLDTQCHNAEFRIVTTAQAYTVDWTIANSRTWGIYLAAFKPAAAGGGVIVGTRRVGQLALMGAGL